MAYTNRGYRGRGFSVVKCVNCVYNEIIDGMQESCQSIVSKKYTID